MIAQASSPPVIPADSLQRVVDSIFAQPAYQWVERRNPLAFLRRWFLALLDWLRGLESTQPALYWFLFSVLVALLVAIVVHAVVVMSRTLRAARLPAEAAATPLARTRGAAWYRAEAVRLAAAGRYPDAMQADFLGLVLELDQRHLLRFHPSKTPREYSLELHAGEGGRDTFRGLVGTLYRCAFARAPCGPAEFAQWQGATQAERYAAPV